MAEIERTKLFGKLNKLCYQSIESATTFCKMRGNPYVELAHWVNQMLQLQDSDLLRIFKHFEIDGSRLAADIAGCLEALPRGATAISDFSPHIEESIERAWVYTTLMFDDASIRSGYLLYGGLVTPGLKNVFFNLSKELLKIKPERLAEELDQIVEGSTEGSMAAQDGSSLETKGDGVAPAAMGKQEALKKFSVDLTEKARNGEMDPVLGRDEEIRQIIDILMRRKQNNPILTGEAGVGKTAVVEGFAQRIIRGDVPPALQDVSLHCLDMGLLQAGASMKGEFENRLRQVIEEVQSSPKPIILFIDEAHTLIGAGGQAGTGDAANLLKPALARGTLRTIAATTWAEYKKYFEKDPALTRRFQVVKVEEPSEKKAIAMIRGLDPVLSKHHKVSLLDEAFDAAVHLSHRYIPARQLPDKAVSLIDTACARVAVSQHATPPQLDDCLRSIENLETELSILGKEMGFGLDHSERKTELEEELGRMQEQQDRLQKQWDEEKALVNSILEIRKKLAGDESAEPGEVEGTDEAKEVGQGADAGAEVLPTIEILRELEEKLVALQGESPLIHPIVNEQAVASVVADWTGIPVGRMVKDEVQSVLSLVDHLEERVVGQTHAMEAITKRIQTSRAGLDNPQKPIGVFLLAGTSGVGKTETALALAETLYGGESNLITINMSEFQEAHTVSTLKGAPPGYVGYGEGGVLTEAVRRRPYSVVLLDEVEKAHSDVHELFFQVFDKGSMEDGEGRQIDFKNTIILLTTNVGSDLIMSLCKDPDLMPDPEGIAEALRDPLLKVFPAALLGRMITIPYYPLKPEVLKLIINLQLNRIKKRLLEGQKIPFDYDDSVVELVLKRCNDVESGGRVIDAILTNTLLPAMSKQFLERMIEGNPVERVSLSVENDDFTYEFS